MTQGLASTRQSRVPEWLWPIVRSEWTSYILLAGAVAGPAASGLDLDGAIRGLLIATGVGFAVLEARRANLIRSRRREEVKQAKEVAAQAVAELHVLLESLLVPIAELLAEIPDTPGLRDRRNLSDRLIEKVLDAAQGICGPNTTVGTRAVYFKLAGDELKYFAHNGRGDRPRHALPPDAVTLALSKKAVLQPDVAADPNPIHFAEASYKTFISSSVYAGSTVYGLLTVDAAQANSLTSNDLRVVGLLSHLLGGGIAMGNGTR